MLTLYRYSLPFHKPFITPKGTYSDREGVLLHFETGHYSAMAEASPLPGFSDELLEDTERLLIEQKETLEPFLTSAFTFPELNSALSSLYLPPSAQFALSSLGASILLKSGRATLEEMFPQPFRQKVMVNAVTGIGNRAEIISSVTAHHARGFRTVKLKSTPDPETLVSALWEVTQRFPDMTFRIDANQSWAVSDALPIIGLFTGLNVEYIEEPIPAGSVSDYRDLVHESPITIALDESLSGMKSLEKAFQTLPDTVLIIKPNLLGNIFRICETISTKKGPLHRVVVTTALESAVGRSMVQSMAAITGDPDLAHGLDTGRLFKQDLFSLPVAINGVLNISNPFISCKLLGIDQNLIHIID